jgi:hypothetical protein
VFPRLLRQSECNDRLKAAAPLMEAALRWLADHTPGSAELLRLMDATPIPCGQSVITARRSDLFGYARYGYCPSHLHTLVNTPVTSRSEPHLGRLSDLGAGPGGREAVNCVRATVSR